MSSPYLEENFGPVHVEHTIANLKVTGTIPAHLDGRYLRIGPNPIPTGPRMYHWLLGDGMVHGVRLRDGRAEWYRNRWVRTGPVAADLGEPAKPGPVHAGLDHPVNLNVIRQDGRLFAVIEAGMRPYEMTGDLETVGVSDFGGTLPGGYSGHAHRDPATGELHAVSYYIGWGNKVQYSVLGTDARIRRTVDIEVTGAPMMHTLSLTENYVILYDLPVTFDPGLAAQAMPRLLVPPARALLSRIAGRSIPEPIATRYARFLARSRHSGTYLFYSWDPGYPARVGVLPRTGSAADVRWFDIEPCYVFHPINAYEDGDSIVIDVVRHPKMFDRLLENMLLHDAVMYYQRASTVNQWTIDLAAGKVREERLDESSAQEFPRIDERLIGRRYRYGYTVGFGIAPVGRPDDTVIKHDVTTGNILVRHLGQERGAGEFAFVPDSPEAAEDQGVLMGYVHDASTDRSDLMLLDAQTLDTVAAIHLPVRVPHGFHGDWFPSI